jgi:heat-inducible transcriptional repressor
VIDLGVSAATIRNVMMELEDLDLITHTHQSAGRIPTDRGYRWYVDHLRQMIALTPLEENSIRQNIQPAALNVDDLLKTTSYVLGEISHQVGLVLMPQLEQGVCERIQLVHLAEKRILLVMTFQAGIIKTLTMELSTVIPRPQLETTEQVLNERLAGLTLGEIQHSMKERLKDARPADDHLIGAFYQTVPGIAAHASESSLLLSDISHWVIQPEFESPENLRQVLSVLNKKELIAQLLRDRSTGTETTVTIGQENPAVEIQPFSLITSQYKVGDIVGILGILGPRRMEYSRIIPFVRSTADIITNILLYH